MLGSSPIRTRVLWSVVTLAALTACGGDGGGGPDERCFGVAQVPAWTVTMNVAFADAGTADSFSIRLHHTIAATALTGAGETPNDGPDTRQWFSGVPEGTLSVHDTIINTNSNDTIVGAAATFVGLGNTNVASIPGMYVGVGLTGCTATVGAQFVSAMTITLNDTVPELDTIFVGYPLFPMNEVTDASVLTGWQAMNSRVRSITANAQFTGQPEYRVGSLVGPYTNSTSNASVVLDSATVSWSAVPASTPAPAGMPATIRGPIIVDGKILQAPRVP